MQNKTCCFIGHRRVDMLEEGKKELYKTIEDLIVEKGVSVFLFGSKSQFNTICHKAVTEIKEKYPEIKRIYVRAEYPCINDDYKSFLLESYEDTYYPESVLNSGKACYIKRNFEMINKSDYCIIYYNDYYRREHYEKKSGTKLVLDYAKNRRLKMINIYK